MIIVVFKASRHTWQKLAALQLKTTGQSYQKKKHTQQQVASNTIRAGAPGGGWLSVIPDWR